MRWCSCSGRSARPMLGIAAFALALMLLPNIRKGKDKAMAA
jgi:hypothetical protein